eukprot:11046136-Prorocentrum_lima.AAC.1
MGLLCWWKSMNVATDSKRQEYCGKALSRTGRRGYPSGVCSGVECGKREIRSSARCCLLYTSPSPRDSTSS